MINLAFSELLKEITEDDIKKEAASIPHFLREKNTAYIEHILLKKHRPSAYRSLASLRLLGKLLYPLTASPVLKRDKNGRPYLIDLDKIDFNISHTESLAICAVCVSENSDIAPKVGIDVEDIYIKDPTALVDRFFSEGEKQYFYASDNKKQTFTEIWTKKEAYIKYIGTGLATPLTSFDTTANPGVKFETFKHGNSIITVCADSRSFPIIYG